MFRAMSHCLLLLSALVGSSALAQSEDRIVAHPAVTELDFSERLVSAHTDKPGLVLVSEHKGARFASMIPLRRDFDRELFASAEEVR